MTQTTPDTTTVWTPADGGDSGTYLCTAHAIKELNSSFSVMFGLQPPFESMDEIQQYMRKVTQQDTDYFVSHEPDADHACAACANGEPFTKSYLEDVQAEDAAGELAEVLQFVNPPKDKTDE